MKNKRNSLKIITAGVAATLLALGGGVAFADQGSGGQSGQCGRSDFHRGLFSSHETATCEYAGAAFAYFAYDTTSAVSVDIRSSAGAGGEGGTKTISSNCVQYGGFYHYGYTDIKYVDTTANGTTENVIWGFGSIGNPGRVGALADRSHADYDLPSSISHVLKQNGVQVAHGVQFDYESTVYPRYEEWLAASGASNIWNDDPGLSWFCWSPTIQKTNYNGSSEGFVNNAKKTNNSTTTVYANSANIRFEHTISRLNNGADQAISTAWYVTGNWPYSNGSVSLNKNESRMVYMYGNQDSGYINPGETKTFSQQLHYNHEADTSGSRDEKTPGAFTLYVKRPISNTMNGRVLAKVDNVAKANGSTTEISGSSFTISFQHEISRGDDSANGTVNVPWSTEVWGQNSRGYDVTPRGTARSGTYSDLGENSGWQAVVTYATESFTGTLLPDETKTYCQRLTYASTLDYANGNTNRTTAWYCVSVHRPKAACSDNEELGVHSGKNKGRIQAQKNNGTWLDTGLKDTGNSEIVVWARPSNKIHFKEEMCEGAEMSNQYYDLGKSISYGITATSNTYMDNLNPSSWDNSNINDYAHAGTDIFGTHTYSKNTASPSSSNYSTKYNITDSHLGSSLYQQLTWTDLWVDGNSVNRIHNGRRNATAKATVYIPYNYRTKPETTSNSTPYILPGTSTFTIEPSIKIEKRTNTPVNGSTAYSTKTKPSKYQVVSYYIANGTAASDVTIKNNGYFTGSGSINLASYCNGWFGWGNGNPYNCQQLRSGESTYDGNGTGDDNVVALPSTSLTVAEDVPIGTKICTVAAVWPSDSHNTQNDITDASQESAAIDALENQNRRMWKISEPTCSTVAKRPNIQVKQNDAYAEQKINTATSHRKLYGTNDVYSYGSWSEFALISANDTTTGILGMGSGASLWGGIRENNDANKYCYVSSMTFSNSHCSGENRYLGKLGVNKLLASDPENIAKQIKTRYTINNGVTYGESGRINVLQSYGSCIYDESTGTYTPSASGYDTPTFNCLDNGTNYTKVRGSAATDSYPNDSWLKSNSAHKANAWVTEAEDAIYIRQNSYYGTLSGAPDKIMENTPYTNINELAQSIFIAKKIYISPEVTHIDAWLIADEIDTCYPGAGVAVSVSNCNTQLTVTGPVIAKKVYLNRTYGGGKVSYGLFEAKTAAWWRSENAQGAEIFSVSPAVYLWSYSQSQRYSQAVMTYSKELPTRY